jgi:UDP-N-acetylmuramate--alanine ligase
VAGTHGKTTTTSMIAVVLGRAGLSPSFVIGGELNEIGSGAECGTGDVFVAEADESDGTFLLLEPGVGVVTNVEEDHLTFYSDREDIERAFASFARRCGRLIACWDDAGVRRFLEGSGIEPVTYGTGPEVDLRLRVEELEPYRARGVVEVEGREISLDLAVPGEHNLLNACAAVAAAGCLGVAAEDAAAALSSFAGVRRRFERRGEAGGATFVDDYSHHPTEISAALSVARGVGGRVVAVCQPLRYSRTQSMWRALGESLAAADVAVVTDPYAASEQPIPGVTGKLIVDAFAESAPGRRVIYLRHLAEVAPVVAGLVRAGDLVITIGGGGDAPMIGEEVMELLREREEAAREAVG